MTEQDKDLLNEQLKEGKILPEMQSKIDSLLNFLKPKREKRGQGCFGSVGLNRKQNKKLEMQKRIQEILKQEKLHDRSLGEQPMTSEERRDMEQRYHEETKNASFGEYLNLRDSEI